MSGISNPVDRNSVEPPVTVVWHPAAALARAATYVHSFAIGSNRRVNPTSNHGRFSRFLVEILALGVACVAEGCGKHSDSDPHSTEPDPELVASFESLRANKRVIDEFDCECGYYPACAELEVDWDPRIDALCFERASAGLRAEEVNAVIECGETTVKIWRECIDALDECEPLTQEDDDPLPCDELALDHEAECEIYDFWTDEHDAAVVACIEVELGLCGGEPCIETLSESRNNTRIDRAGRAHLGGRFAILRASIR